LDGLKSADDVVELLEINGGERGTDLTQDRGDVLGFVDHPNAGGIDSRTSLAGRRRARG
jgi:hypothetical protein